MPEPGLFEPTDRWYHDELASHQRKQALVRKAYRDAKATYTPTREHNMATKTDLTVNEAAAEAVHWFSYHDVSKRYGRPGERGVTMEQCAAEAWQTPLGKELRALMLAYGDQPVSTVTTAIRKDGNAERFAKALDVIRDGWPR